MNYEEFKARTSGCATYDIFAKYEKMYMAGHLDKDEFCEMVKGRVLKEIEMAQIQEALEYYQGITRNALKRAEYANSQDEFDEALRDAKRYGEQMFVERKRLEDVKARV